MKVNNLCLFLPLWIGTVFVCFLIVCIIIPKTLNSYNYINNNFVLLYLTKGDELVAAIDFANIVTKLE